MSDVYKRLRESAMYSHEKGERLVYLTTDLAAEIMAKLILDKDSEGGCMTSKQAINCLSVAFKSDPDYAHVWHCNIAMCFVDAFPKDAGVDYSAIHAAANDAAERFMFAAFGIKSSSNPDGSEIAQERVMKELNIKLEAGIATLEADLDRQLKQAMDIVRERESRIAALEADLARANNLIADFVDDDDTPDANCSCHINPPCSDCVNYGWRRELITRAKAMRPERAISALVSFN